MSRRVALLVCLGVLSACSSGSSTHDAPARSTPSFSMPSGVSGPTCSTPRATPDPTRPRMALTFTLAPDHRTVTGTEKVTFRPDLPVDELVFRLAANAPETVDGGNGVTVTRATTDHGTAPATYTPSGAAAGTQGGLLHLPLAQQVPAGTTITADIDFTVTLGKPYFDRFGRAGRFAWFGSAEPLLAWQRGVGWHTEDLAQVSFETTTSEAMDVDLTVHAPAADTVLMSGDPTDPPRSSKQRTWHRSITAARDVSVAAGPFHVADAKVGDVRLRVGTPTSRAAPALVREGARAIQSLARMFGPYPFPSLSLALLPARGGGIEYPSSVLLFGPDRYLVVHEVAHQWFYAMVGNSQALHPWLDEAFATYAEAIVDGAPGDPKDLQRPGRVDSTTESFGAKVRPAFNTIYLKGSQALRAAREAAGAAAFDQAVRCYVARNAWSIATPADLAAALAQLPAATRVLRRAGALP